MGVADHVSSPLVVRQFVDPLTVDFDNFEAHEASQWLEGTREPYARTYIGPEHLVGVDMAVIVPTRPIPARVVLRPLATSREQRVENQLQP